MTFRSLLTLLTLLTLVACSEPSSDRSLQTPIAAPSEPTAPEPEPQGLNGDEPASRGTDTSWVARQIVGGKQCDSASRFQPPDTRGQLVQAGIEVRDSGREALMVCMACDICPGYAYLHFALIPDAQIGRAQSLGFELREPELPLEPDYSGSNDRSEPEQPDAGYPRS